MSKTFYTATKDNRGCMATFNWNTKLPPEGEKPKFGVYVVLRAQTGTSKSQSGRSNGVYGKDGASISTKLSETEIGLMLWAIENRKSVKDQNKDKPLYHANPHGATLIDFSPHPGGYTFSLSSKPKNGEGIRLGLNLSVGDVWSLQQWFKDALTHIHTANYSYQIKQAQKYAKKDG